MEMRRKGGQSSKDIIVEEEAVIILIRGLILGRAKRKEIGSSKFSHQNDLF